MELSQYSLKIKHFLLDYKLNYDQLVIHLFWIAVILRFLWLEVPNDWYMSDEQHFVRAAIQLVYHGNFIDKPHPPLALPLLSVGVFLFRNTSWGWRIMPVVFGSACIPIFYLLTKKIATAKVAFLTTFLFSFENLVFQMSRIAMIDIFPIFFTLLGYYLYFRKNYRLSAISLGLSLLSKQTAICSVVALVIYHLVTKGKLKLLAKYLLFCGVFTFAFWWILDVSFGIFNNPIEHFQYTYFYKTESALAHRGLVWGDLYAWQFLIPLAGKVFLWSWSTTTLALTPAGQISVTRLWIEFDYVTNPAIIIMVIPTFIYLFYKYQKTRDNAAIFATIWFLTYYIPFLIPTLTLDIAYYLYYFLPLIPPICTGIALSLNDLSIKVRNGDFLIFLYLVIVAVNFAYFCPFKSIPPTPLVGLHSKT